MKYLSGPELRVYEQWIENNLAPKLQEAFNGLNHLRNGKFAARISFVRKGLGLVDYLRRAKSVEEQMAGIERFNSRQ